MASFIAGVTTLRPRRNGLTARSSQSNPLHQRGLPIMTTILEAAGTTTRTRSGATTALRCRWRRSNILEHRELLVDNINEQTKKMRKKNGALLALLPEMNLKQ